MLPGDDEEPTQARPTSGRRDRSGERLVPGAVIDGRYRIVALLGQGGMGEVYRADDLKLGQPVALKFLPEGREGDAKRRELLLDEVRVARRVAHPSVCRVYDIGEANGHHFICMEYVDGEDLATLLRRIGRLPGDKATELARQICAGLAAAQAQGILHRDLKPANVMIDGRGRARITDFGLAREAEAVSGRAARDGTPAYMAPEQLAGREATARSDIYALGLVLYELFTGRQPFASRTFEEAVQERSSGLPASPSSHVPDLDPAVERTILRCLEPDPARRPSSALHIAASLPGGDPLGAALAAGETPSPEMVAAAPTEGTVKPAFAAGAALFCLVAVVGGLVLEYRTVLGPAGRPPIVLADRARQVLEKLGHSTSGHDEAWGYLRPQAAVDRVRDHPDEATAMMSGGAPPLYTFWYRSAPGTLMPRAEGRVSPSDPPRGAERSAMVVLRTDGALLGLEAWPSRERGSARGAGADWSTPLELSGLDAAALEPDALARVPPMFADERVSWRGAFPAGTPLQVDGAAAGGRAVFWRIYGPESSDVAAEAEELPPVFMALLYLLFTGILAAGAWLARGNLLSGRGDRRGALRLGLVIGGAWLLSGVLGSTHGMVPEEVVRLWSAGAESLLVGALTAMFYLGLEPSLRRRWPHRFVAWTRLLDGRFLDPLVGRELLLGAVGAVVFVYFPVVGSVLSRQLGWSQRHHVVMLVEPAAWGVPGVLSSWPGILAFGVLMALGFAVLTLSLIMMARNQLLGALLVTLVMAFGLSVRDSLTEPAPIFVHWLLTVLITVTLLRVGLLASATLLFLGHLGLLYPVTQFTGAWYAGGRPVLVSTIVVVAAYGAWTCARPVRYERWNIAS